MTQPASPPSLADRVPPRAGAPPDELLDLFLGHVRALGLELYPAQEQAILELLSGSHVILATPTGSGKSLVALAAHFFALCEGKRSFYTAPIKALVSEKFFALCRDFGADNVGMHPIGILLAEMSQPVIRHAGEVELDGNRSSAHKFSEAAQLVKYSGQGWGHAGTVLVAHAHRHASYGSRIR